LGAGRSGSGLSDGVIKDAGFLPGLLPVHYRRHKREFKKIKTMEEYEEKAKQFFASPITSNVYWFKDHEGVLTKYNKVSNEFGVCRPEGGIVTYFKPTDKLKYYRAQEADHGA